MKINRSLVLSVVTVLVLTATAQGQQLPSHGAAAAGKTPTIIESVASPGATYAAWEQDIGLDILYVPSPDDDRLKDGLGLGLSYTIPLQRYNALRLNAAYESFSGESGFDDADILPIGFSFMLGIPTDGPVKVGFELGIRYCFVDAEDVGGDYDNAFNGVAGIQLATQGLGGFDVEFGAGYRLDISASENDAGEELSLEGLQLRLALRVAL